MTSLGALIAGLREGTLKLPEACNALGERGGIPERQYLREVAWIKHLRDNDGFEPEFAEALLAQLAALQPAAPEQPSAGQADAPANDQSAATADDLAEGTIVQPRSRPAPTQSTGTGGSAGSMNTSSWQRVAGEAGGEYATVGMLLKGRFLLERELGRGGMGVVYLARDERKVEARDRDPYVAVKVLNDEFRRHPDSLIALQRESRRSQQLAHDNIVRVYDFDKDGTIVFMTMEYIDGTSLKTLIREEAFDGMPLAKARPLIEGMGWALKRAHTAGVVHSDFKPGNVMVTTDGVAKVFDFGIARAGKFVEAAGEQTVFDAGTLGALTPSYASLEMLRGAEPRPTDDIYAFGCVVYELLTGKHPFDKKSAEVALKEGLSPPRVHGLTKRQNKALADAVALDAKRRTQTVIQVVEGLRDIGWRERVGRPLAWAALVLLLLAAAGWGIRHELSVRHVAQVVARFQPDQPGHYTSETQAIAALAGLDNAQRKQLLIEHADVVQRFLLQRVDAYWNPAKGHRDFASAQRVFTMTDKLGLFLPKLELKRATIAEEKHELEHPAKPAQVATTPSKNATGDGGQAAADKAAAQEAARKEQQAIAESKARMQNVAARLIRQGRQNYAQQKYSAAIANAQAALQVNPGDPAAGRLLRQAQQAQKRAMGNIQIH